MGTLLTLCVQLHWYFFKLKRNSSLCIHTSQTGSHLWQILCVCVWAGSGLAGAIKSSFLSISKQPPVDTTLYLHVLVFPLCTCERFPECLVCFSMFLRRCVCALLSSLVCFSLRSQAPPLPPAFFIWKRWSWLTGHAALQMFFWTVPPSGSKPKPAVEGTLQKSLREVFGTLSVEKYRWLKFRSQRMTDFFPSIIPNKVHNKYCQNFSLDN